MCVATQGGSGSPGENGTKTPEICLLSGASPCSNHYPPSPNELFRFVHDTAKAPVFAIRWLWHMGQSGQSSCCPRQDSYLCPSVYCSPMRDEPPFLRTYEWRLLPNEIPGKLFKSFLKIVLRNKCKNEMASKQQWNGHWLHAGWDSHGRLVHRLPEAREGPRPEFRSRTGLCEPSQLKASESQLGSLNQLTCTKATAWLFPWGVRGVETISSRSGMLA